MFDRRWQPAGLAIQAILVPVVGDRAKAEYLLDEMVYDERVAARSAPITARLGVGIPPVRSCRLQGREVNVDELRAELQKIAAQTTSPATATAAQQRSEAIVAIAEELGITPAMNASQRNRRIIARYKEKFGEPIGATKIGEALRGTRFISRRQKGEPR